MVEKSMLGRKGARRHVFPLTAIFLIIIFSTNVHSFQRLILHRLGHKTKQNKTKKKKKKKKK